MGRLCQSRGYAAVLVIMQKGVTLYEILVILGLLGVISTYSIWYVTNIVHRQRARDAVRVSDVSTLMEALEEYYVDNQTFPGEVNRVYRSDVYSVGGICLDNCGNIANGWLPYQLEGYLEKFPVDPSNQNQLIYRYTHDGRVYLLECVFELPDNNSLMQTDGGLNDSTYELGTGVNQLIFN